MPNYALPAIDQNASSSWNEQDVNLYNALPYYLAVMQLERRRQWMTHSKLVGKTRWVPNSGSELRGVQKVPSPHIRQMIFPNAMTSMPMKDVTDVREVLFKGYIYRHRFESQVMSFVPSFKDFMKNHIKAQADDLMEKQERSEEIYIRTGIWYYSPNVYLCGTNGFEAAPHELGNAANNAPNSKNSGWLQATLPKVTKNLQLMDLNRLIQIMDNDLQVMPYSGNSLPKDDQGLADKYCLVCSSEAYMQFGLDPFALQYRNVNLDVALGTFKGSFWGRVTAKLEHLPLRIAADGTFPAPEIRQGNQAEWDYQDTVPNPAYVSAPYEVAWLYGAAGYDSIEVGPPPAAFTGQAQPSNFARMFWNGEVRLINNFLVSSVDATGAVVQDINHYGEYVKYICQTAYGLLPKNRRNVMPLVFERKRGIVQ